MFVQGVKQIYYGAYFRQFPLPPRANEITFADRFSLAVLDSDAYLAYDGKERLAQSFYDDTYLSDQQACTSPHLVVWLGRACAEAREVFWRLLHARVRDRYELAPVQVVDKLDALLRLTASVPVHRVPMGDMRIVRAEAESLTAPLADVRTGSGFFVEYVAKSLQELRPVLGTAVQTVAYFGIPREQVLEAVREMRPRGVDRIVPIGRTMDFSLMWDGYDLIRSLSRRIDAL